MRTTLAVLVVLLIGGCSGDDTANPTTTTMWITSVADPAKMRTETHDGHTVWVDDEERMIYVEDCDTARQLTSDGPYGAQPRNEDGSGGANGYGFICP